MSRSPPRLTRHAAPPAAAGGAGAAALGALPGAGLLDGACAGAFDWKRFKGEKIEVLLVKSPRGDLLQKYEKEFDDLTGIKVGSEQVPEQQQRQKAVIEFNSGKPSFDVIVAFAITCRSACSPRASGWTDLRPMIADPRLTAPDFDFADFAQGGPHLRDAGRRPDRQLADQLDSWMLYYNKELFEKKGVAYPKTFDEIVEAAAKLNDPAEGRARLRRRAG